MTLHVSRISASTNRGPKLVTNLKVYFQDLAQTRVMSLLTGLGHSKGAMSGGVEAPAEWHTSTEGPTGYGEGPSMPSTSATTTRETPHYGKTRRPIFKPV